MTFTTAASGGAGRGARAACEAGQASVRVPTRHAGVRAPRGGGLFGISFSTPHFIEGMVVWKCEQSDRALRPLPPLSCDGDRGSLRSRPFGVVGFALGSRLAV